MRIPSSKYTFESLKNGDIEKIPTESGVYFVVCDNNYKFEYLKITEGIKTYKGKYMTKPIEKLKIIGDKHKNSGSHILYMGKANNLQEGLRQYMNWGYDIADNPHSGGRNIWQLKNNKFFSVAYKIVKEPDKEETRLIDEHIIKYHCKPFANPKRGLKEFWLISKKEEKILYR